jgi:hypothetical protein
MDQQNDQPKEIRYRLRLRPSTIERIEKIGIKERRAVARIIELAVEEISDRGYTDVVTVKAKL